MIPIRPIKFSLGWLQSSWRAGRLVASQHHNKLAAKRVNLAAIWPTRPTLERQEKGGKKGLAATGMAPLFFPLRPRAELDWQDGHGDGSQCDAAVSILPLPPFPTTRVQDSTHTHSQADDQGANCLPHGARGLRGDEHSPGPAAELTSMAECPCTSYKLPHSSDRQHGPRVRAPAAWPCCQSASRPE